MALKGFVTKAEHDALAPELKKEYRQEGDGFVPDVVEVNGFELKQVGKLMSALQTERAERAELERKMKALDGIDPVAARTALADVERMKKWTPEDKLEEKVKAREEQIVKTFTDKLSVSEKRAQALAAAVEAELVDSKFIAACASRGASARLLLPIARQHIKAEETRDGRWVTKIIDPRTGHERLSSKGTGTDSMTMDELLEEFSKDKDLSLAFPATSRPGTGGGSGGSGGKTGAKVISANDPLAMGANLEAISKGDVKVSFAN